MPKETSKERYLREEIERRRAFDKELEIQREERFTDIMNLAQEVCPIEYYRFVLRCYREFGLNYYRPSRKGSTLKDVTCKEIDALIGIGSLNLSEHGMVSIPKRIIKRNKKVRQ